MPPPNILFLVGEDTGCHHGCYGNAIAKTPNIDRLAAEGCRYTNACSTAPVCAPSRSTLVTGQYAFSLGSHHMRSQLLNPPRLFTEELREAGYYVNWANKTDFNFNSPETLADERREWIEDLENGNLPQKPWFLFHNFECTHESSMWEEKWEANILPHLEEAEQTDLDQVQVPAYLPDTPTVRADIAHYFDALALQDKQVGRVLEALERSGQAKNTIVFYLSDHGRGLPREKRWCYDAGIHLPLIVRWPGKLEAGSIDDQLVSWVDLAPTVLNLAGVPIPENYQGRVFLGEGVKTPQRTYCFAGRDRMDEAWDRVRAARSKTYLYIRNFFPQLPYAQRNAYMEKQQTMQELRELDAQGNLNPAQAAWMDETKPEEELYDLRNDPDCVRNLAGHPQQEERLQTMRRNLDTFVQQSGDLGHYSERELINRGLVEDRLQEYHERVEPLPKKYQKGPAKTVVEMPQ